MNCINNDLLCMFVFAGTDDTIKKTDSRNPLRGYKDFTSISVDIGTININPQWKHV